MEESLVIVMFGHALLLAISHFVNWKADELQNAVRDCRQAVERLKTDPTDTAARQEALQCATICWKLTGNDSWVTVLNRLEYQGEVAAVDEGADFEAERIAMSDHLLPPNHPPEGVSDIVD